MYVHEYLERIVFLFETPLIDFLYVQLHSEVGTAPKSINIEGFLPHPVIT